MEEAPHGLEVSSVAVKELGEGEEADIEVTVQHRAGEKKVKDGR